MARMDSRAWVSGHGYVGKEIPSENQDHARSFDTYGDGDESSRARRCETLAATKRKDRRDRTPGEPGLRRQSHGKWGRKKSRAVNPSPPGADYSAWYTNPAYQGVDLTSSPEDME